MFYKNLYNAVNVIEHVAYHINEAIREHENFKKLLEIQKKFSGKTAPNILIVPFRRFIKEGRLFKVRNAMFKFLIKRANFLKLLY